MIQLSDLTKTFGDRVLFDHVTWQITDRERVGLCGPNGAGKTTLLKMMAGLDEPDEGAILKPSALTVGYLSSTYSSVISFGLLTLALLLRPQGLFVGASRESRP